MLSISVNSRPVKTWGPVTVVSRLVQNRRREDADEAGILSNARKRLTPQLYRADLYLVEKRSVSATPGREIVSCSLVREGDVIAIRTYLGLRR